MTHTGQQFHIYLEGGGVDLVKLLSAEGYIGQGQL